MEAMGLEARVATDEELVKMRDITRREMEAGAAGLSTGLITYLVLIQILEN